MSDMAYHHGNLRRALLDAALDTIATEGYEGLAATTAATWQETGSFLEVGVAYVRFAVTHPGHFAVMFRPDLVDPDDPELARAMSASAAMLYGPVESVTEVQGDATARRVAATAAWALVHGIA